MKTAFIACGLLAASSGLAAADEGDGERLQVVSLEGGLVFPEPQDDSFDEYQPIVAARISMAWEQAPVAMPLERGYAWRGGVTPELSVGGVAWVDEDRDEHRQAFLQGGLRLDLSFAQREMGLLRISARGGMWLAGRAGVLADDDHSPIGDLGLGWYLWLGASKYRIGWQLGAMAMPRQGEGAAPMPLDPVRPDGDGECCGDAARFAAMFYMGAFIGAVI